MSCATITKNILATCDGVRKPGGVNARVWVGYAADIDSVTFDATNGHEITAITMKTGKSLYKFEGRKEKNSTVSEMQVGENLNLFNQQVNLILYWGDAGELETLEKLANSEGLVLFVETNAGKIEVYGLSNTGSLFAFGLSGSSYVDSSGTLINDSTGVPVTLSGLVPVSKLIYDEQNVGGLAAAVAALDALVTV